MKQRRTRGGLPAGTIHAQGGAGAHAYAATDPAQPRLRPGQPRQRRRRAGLVAQRRKSRRPRSRIALRIILILVALLSALGLAGIGTVYALYQSYRSSLPDATELTRMEPPLDSHVYDREGNLVATFYSDQRHEHIALRDMSRWIKLATIDVEDKNFYEEGSWSLPRIVKAGWENLRKNSVTQGASTITEQLAKISFLGFGERSWERKAKQVILGIEIENNFSKDQILEMYLNRIEYGNHSVGVESAAQTYFHKSARNLDLAEASMLAGLPQSPAAYYPLTHTPDQSVNPAAKARQRTVLQLMVQNGDLTQAQADAAYAQALTFHYFLDSEPASTNFSEYVREYLQQKFGGAYLNPGGWEIQTTLSPPQQRLAQQTVHDQVASVYGPNNIHDAALVGMDPATGEINSMVGAWDPTNPVVGQLNMATQRVQPGSTIKLFTYTAAIASREFTMRSPVLDAPTRFVIPGSDPYSPENYDHKFHGICLLQACLGNSFNVPAVKVEARLGVPYVTALEVAAGLKSLADPGGTDSRYPLDNRPGPMQLAATLGGLTYGVTPLELADGAATIANLGVHHDPAPVLKIVERSTGKVVYAYDPQAEARRVVPASVAYIVAQMTSNDQNRSYEFGSHGLLTLPDRRVSAKTGTTPNFISNWTVGWTPQLVTVVWVGNPKPSCLRPGDAAKLPRGVDPTQPFTAGELAPYGLQPVDGACGHLDGIVSGITGAAPIWNAFMKAAHGGVPSVWYQKPPDVVQQGPGDDAYFYLPGTAPGRDENHCVHYGPTYLPGDPCSYNGGYPSLSGPLSGVSSRQHTPAPPAPSPAP